MTTKYTKQLSNKEPVSSSLLNQEPEVSTIASFTEYKVQPRIQRRGGSSNLPQTPGLQYKKKYSSDAHDYKTIRGSTSPRGSPQWFSYNDV